ncbi:methyltransferase family protein [Nostoc sp.]|uniref:methyltransferase family protein n=1 Tax=Nostoc sp. TaxID=1180 RepID=UPI002FF9B47C
MGVSQTFFSALRLKVFDSLQESPKTAVELAKAIGGDAHGMQVLLESLDDFCINFDDIPVANYDNYPHTRTGNRILDTS